MIKHHIKELIPFPTMPSRAFSVSREEARLLAQMFLPSTTPAKRYFPEGNPPLINSRVFVPRTRSKPNPVTLFKDVSVLYASTGTSAKYVSTRTFKPDRDASSAE